MITAEQAIEIFKKENPNLKIIGCVFVDGFGFSFSTRPACYGSKTKLVSEDGKYYEIDVRFGDDLHPYNKARRETIIPVNL